jgi:hypothetical protein
VVWGPKPSALSNLYPEPTAFSSAATHSSHFAVLCCRNVISYYALGFPHTRVAHDVWR